MKKSIRMFIRYLIAFGILALFILLMAYIFLKTGVFEEITSIREFSNTFHGYFMYTATYYISMLLVLVPIFPLTMAFTSVSPAWLVILLSFIANVAGAMTLYYAGRYGFKMIINWVSGDEKTLRKWQELLYKGKYTIFLMILFPFSPNQLIMVLCGTGKMKLGIYVPIITFGQLIGITTMVLFTKSLYILRPLWIWLPLMFITIILLMYLSFKYQEQIDAFFMKLLKKTG